MVYAHKIRIAHLEPRDEVEGVIERPFEWIFFELPVTEVSRLSLPLPHTPGPFSTLAHLCVFARTT
jgi:hypothetical protein